jgi:TonB family protein
MRVLSLVAFSLLAISTQLLATQPVKFDKRQLLDAASIRKYRIEWPAWARQRGMKGSGIYILHINSKTGGVTSVAVQKSTGYGVLDDCVIAASRQWRFKPHLVTDVWLAVTFWAGKF